MLVNGIGKQCWSRTVLEWVTFCVERAAGSGCGSEEDVRAVVSVVHIGVAAVGGARIARALSPAPPAPSPAPAAPASTPAAGALPSEVLPDHQIHGCAAVASVIFRCEEFQGARAGRPDTQTRITSGSSTRCTFSSRFSMFRRGLFKSTVSV